MNPTNLQELINLLTKIQTEQGGETMIEFQDYDEDEREVEIVIESKTDYTDYANSTKKLVIRYL